MQIMSSIINQITAVCPVKVHYRDIEVLLAYNYVSKRQKWCVVNQIFTLQQSGVCRAGLHAGVIDNDGGWLDVTRQGRKDFFIKSNKNGIQSLG